RSSLCHAPATTELYTLSLHDALPIWRAQVHECEQRSHLRQRRFVDVRRRRAQGLASDPPGDRRAPEGAARREFRSQHAKSRHEEDRKSTRLNSSHRTISYAVFCLKKK